MYRTLFTLALVFTLWSCYQRPAEVERPLEIGIITDVQYCPCPARGSRHYAQSLEKLHRSLNHFSQTKPAFLVSLGDLIEKDAENFTPLLEAFSDTKVPIHHVLGNHDYEIADSLKRGLPELLDMPHTYYQVSRKHWRFLFLDGNDLSFHATPKGSLERDSLFAAVQSDSLPQAQQWNGGLSAEQLAWVEQALLGAAEEEQKVVVFSHYPIYPKDQHNLWNDNKLLLLLQRFPQVKAYISGHNHAGFYSQEAGIHFLGVKAMVEGPEEASFANLRLFENKIEVKGHGGEPDRILSLQQP